MNSLLRSPHIGFSPTAAKQHTNIEENRSRTGATAGNRERDHLSVILLVVSLKYRQRFFNSRERSAPNVTKTRNGKRGTSHGEQVTGNGKTKQRIRNQVTNMAYMVQVTFCSHFSFFRFSAVTVSCFFIKRIFLTNDKPEYHHRG